MLIDSHVHLEMPQFDKDREEVINRFLDNGVGLVINIGSNLDNSKKAVELARNHKFIYATVGIHPHDSRNAGVEAYAEIETLLKNEKVVAVGETGLDFFKNYSPRDIQTKEFIKHIQIAKKHDKSIIVHCREAED